MSFRAIASAYGCSYSMPYTYFASKAALIDGLRLRVYRWLQDVLEDAAASTADPIEALEAIARAYVRAGLSRPRFYELLYSNAGSIAEDDPAFLDAKLGALNVCRDAIVAAARAAGQELVTDPDTAAHLFWVAAHGLVSLEHGGFLVAGRTSDQVLSELFQVMARGIVVEPADVTARSRG